MANGYEFPEGEWQEESGSLFQFKEPGTTLVGKLTKVGKGTVEGREVGVAWIQADLGKVFIYLTAQLEVLAGVKIGTKVGVQYIDDTELDGGRKVKNFKVYTAKSKV